MATAKPSLLHTAISAILEYAGSFDLLVHCDYFGSPSVCLPICLSDNLSFSI